MGGVSGGRRNVQLIISPPLFTERVKGGKGMFGVPGGVPGTQGW